MQNCGGILQGLRIAQQRFVMKVFIESDSAASISLVSSGCHSAHPCAELVRAIHDTMSGFSQVRWGHIFREANAVADALAKHGLDLDESLVVFDTVPSFCSVFFLLDSASTVYRRGL